MHALEWCPVPLGPLMGLEVDEHCSFCNLFRNQSEGQDCTWSPGAWKHCAVDPFIGSSFISPHGLNDFGVVRFVDSSLIGRKAFLEFASVSPGALISPLFEGLGPTKEELAAGQDGQGQQRTNEHESN